MQRLLERAAWDASDAMRVIRAFVVSGLGDLAGAVLVLDESGQEKAGRAHRRGETPVPGVRGAGGQRH
jgi:hypothetical protein